MSVSFCVAFEAQVPPHGILGADHGALTREKDSLDRLASEHGLVPLGAFESYGADDAAGVLDEDELEELQLPEAEWFDPAAGLAAVRALAGWIRSHSDAVDDHEEVLADLTGIEAELAAAQRAGVRFRFAFIM
jgi:hypothetical protein